MALQMCFIIVLSLFFTYGNSEECTQKKVSCNDIKIDDGFKFVHNDPGGSQISVYRNETLIAYLVPFPQLVEHTEEVISIDNSSVITRSCRDLHVEHSVPDGPFHIKVICSDFKITDEGKHLNPNDSSSQEDQPSDGVPSYVIVPILITVIFIVCVFCFVGMRRKVCCFRKQKGGATVLWCKHVVCLETGISPVQTEKQETSGLPSSPDQHGAVESDAEQDITLDSVLVPSNDATAHDDTLQSDCPDGSWSSEEIQTTNNEELGTSDVNRASNHLTIYRNMRDDPGGVNDNKGKEILRGTHTGWTHGDRGREGREGREGHEGHEGHENEEKPLLVNPRASIQGFYMKGEAAVLENIHSFDQDQNNSCSATPMLRLLSDARRGVDARHEKPHRDKNL